MSVMEIIRDQALRDYTPANSDLILKPMMRILTAEHQHPDCRNLAASILTRLVYRHHEIIFGRPSEDEPDLLPIITSLMQDPEHSAVVELACTITFPHLSIGSERTVPVIKAMVRYLSAYERPALLEMCMDSLIRLVRECPCRRIIMRTILFSGSISSR